MQHNDTLTVQHLQHITSIIQLKGPNSHLVVSTLCETAAIQPVYGHQIVCQLYVE